MAIKLKFPGQRNQSPEYPYIAKRNDCGKESYYLVLSSTQLMQLFDGAHTSIGNIIPIPNKEFLSEFSFVPGASVTITNDAQ